MIMVEEDRRSRQGAWLLLVSLAAFFLSSMILFVVYVARRTSNLGDDAHGYSLPSSFAISTFLLICISASLHYAVYFARRDNSVAVVRLTFVSLGLAVGFLMVQSEGMYILRTRSLIDSSFNSSLYPFTFLLALVHALHVVGGVIGLIVVVIKAIQLRYDHERHWGLQFCAMYWHFLDLVWLAMLVGFGTAIFLIHRNAV